MKILPLVKVWTGDSYAGGDPMILTQVKRTDKVALYSRRKQSESRIEGFELFHVEIRHKGDPLPGGTVEPEDREVYPSANKFGRTAFALGSNEENALNRFNQLVEELAGQKETVVVEPVKVVGVDADGAPKIQGTFTIHEFAEIANLPYQKALVFVKNFIDIGKMKCVGQAPPTGSRGKIPNLYSYV